MRDMSYPPPPNPQYGGPVPPPQQPVVKSKAGPIIGIILGVLLLGCIVCGGAFAYFTWWANDKVNEIVDNLPTDFPTDFPTPVPKN
jgi:hypothetical protein